MIAELLPLSPWPKFKVKRGRSGKRTSSCPTKQKDPADCKNRRMACTYENHGHCSLQMISNDLGLGSWRLAYGLSPDSTPTPADKEPLAQALSCTHGPGPGWEGGALCAPFFFLVWVWSGMSTRLRNHFLPRWKYFLTFPKSRRMEKNWLFLFPLLASPFPCPLIFVSFAPRLLLSMAVSEFRHFYRRAGPVKIWSSVKDLNI